MKLIVVLFLLTWGCVKKSENSQEKGFSSIDASAGLDPARVLCQLDGPKNVAGVVDYPYVHLSEVKGQKILVFGYAKVDLGFEALKGLFSSEKTFKAPEQNLAIVVNPESAVVARVTAEIRNTSCVLDVERSMLSLLKDFKNTIYLTVQTPALNVILKPSVSSFCDMHVDRMTLLNSSDLDRVNLKVQNPNSTWWGPIGQLFTEGFVNLLKNTASVTGNESGLQEFVLTQMSEAFDQDMLKSVKKSLGCRQ